MTVGSPYASYTAHGTIVAASAQPARPNRSRPFEHDVRDDARHAQHRVLLEREVPQPARARTPRRRTACEPVGANAWASPVQPSRSSRCGQSVGHGHEVVALRPDDVLVEPVQRRRREHSNVAASRRVAADRDELGVEELGVGLDLRVPEAVERERRLEDDRLVVGEDVGVGRLARSAARGCGATPSGSRTSACRTVTTVAARPADAEPHVARRCSGRRRARHGRRRAASARHAAAPRRRGPAARCAARSTAASIGERPATGASRASSKPGASQPSCALAEVDRRTRRTGRRTGSRRSTPATSRPSRSTGVDAVGQVDLELGEQGRPRVPYVPRSLAGLAAEATAIPAVADHGAR